MTPEGDRLFQGQLDEAAYDGFILALRIQEALGNTVDSDAVFNFVRELRPNSEAPSALFGSPFEAEKKYRREHPDAEDFIVEAYLRDLEQNRSLLQIDAARVAECLARYSKRINWPGRQGPTG